MAAAPWTLLALLLLVSGPLAGCFTEPGIKWSQPLEVRAAGIEGTAARVAWGDGFAIEYIAVPGQPRHVVVDEALYRSHTLTGWTEYPWDLTNATGAGEWPALLDLRGLLDDPGIAVEEEGADDIRSIRAGGVRSAAGRSWNITVQIRVQDDVVRSARIEGADVPGAPVTLVAGRAPAAPPEAPDRSLPAAARSRLDDDALRAHTRVAVWLDAWEREGRDPPPVLDAASLEPVMDGPWPTDPFTGGPLTRGTGSGDFAWTTCPGGAAYAGRGWDGVLVTRSLYDGCPAP